MLFGALKDMFRETAEISKESGILGVSPEVLQFFKLLSAQTGVSIDELHRMMIMDTENRKRWIAEIERSLEQLRTAHQIFDDSTVRSLSSAGMAWKSFVSVLKTSMAEIVGAMTDLTIKIPFMKERPGLATLLSQPLMLMALLRGFRKGTGPYGPTMMAGAELWDEISKTRTERAFEKLVAELRNINSPTHKDLVRRADVIIQTINRVF
jgi:hypothetical protein